MPGTPGIIRSTSDLTPNGILGYAKAIAAAVGAILAGVAELIPDSWPYKTWVQGGILVCTVIATYAIPNPVEPVVVTPPPVTGVVPPPVPPPNAV